MNTSTENLNLMEVESADVLPEKVLNEELETFIMASKQTLKRSNKKCGIDEVFELEIFESHLYRLTEKQSVKVNVLGKRTCFSLPKEFQLKKEITLIIGPGSKEDKEYYCDIINENEFTERVNVIDNDSSKSEENFFRRFSDI